MFYMKWDEQSISGLAKHKGCVVLYTEVSPSGLVQREIGLKENGWVKHRFPSLYEKRGLFDNQLVDATSLKNDISEKEFNELWEKELV